MRCLLFCCLVLAFNKPALADGNWVDGCVVGPFVCRAEFELSESRKIIRQLPQLQTSLERWLGLSIPEKTIEINIFRNKWSYRRYISKRIPGGTRRQALYVQGPDRGRIYVYHHWGFEEDIRHECTHALLHNALPYLPMWLDEGLAEYFEVPPTERAQGHSHLRSVRWIRFFGWSPDLGRLEKMGNVNDMDGGDYRDSWAWVHFLLHHSPQSLQILRGYLKAIQSDRPPGRFSRYVETRIPNAERQVVRHFKSWK